MASNVSGLAARIFYRSDLVKVHHVAEQAFCEFGKHKRHDDSMIFINVAETTMEAPDF